MASWLPMPLLLCSSSTYVFWRIPVWSDREIATGRPSTRAQADGNSRRRALEMVAEGSAGRPHHLQLTIPYSVLPHGRRMFSLIRADRGEFVAGWQSNLQLPSNLYLLRVCIQQVVQVLVHNFGSIAAADLKKFLEEEALTWSRTVRSHWV